MKKIFTVIIIILILLLCLTWWETPRREVCGEVDRSYSVVLDAGHGGTDGGALGITTGCKEADINLAITLKTKALLESAQVHVVLTRDNEGSLCGEPYSKQRDMQLRARLINDAAPDIVVSVHMNSYPNASVKGAQVFYYPDSEQGEALAGKIQESFVRHADKENKRVIKEGDFFLLRTYAGPSALVECGFLTCPEEERLLLEQEYQDIVAYSIFDGIMRYLMTL